MIDISNSILYLQKYLFNFRLQLSIDVVSPKHHRQLFLNEYLFGRFVLSTDGIISKQLSQVHESF